MWDWFITSRHCLDWLNFSRRACIWTWNKHAFYSWNQFGCRKLIYFDFDMLNKAWICQGFVGVLIAPWDELTSTLTGNGEFWPEYGWWWQNLMATTVFKGTVKNEDKDPIAQMEWCRKPIIGAINELHITAWFEIAQTNINKKKVKTQKL